MSSFDPIAFLQALTPEEAVAIARRLSPRSPHLAAWVALLDKRPGALSYLAQRRPVNRASSLQEEFPAILVRELLRLGVDPFGEKLSPGSKREFARADRLTWIATTLGRDQAGGGDA